MISACSNTSPITDGEGKEVPASITSVEEIELQGVDQWITIRGVDRNAPVFLWVAGGPGGSELAWTRQYLGELEQEVVFVNWEQPGTGKSYGAVNIEEMKVEDYVDHLVALSEYLRERFDKEKIFLVGHSWGSIIGLMAADRRPDLYHAFVSVGQHVNARENDLIGYDLVLDRAARAGEQKVVKKLQKHGPPPYTVEEKGKYTYLFQKLYVFSPRGVREREFNSMSMFTPEEYSVFDTINLVRGLVKGVNYIYPQLVGLNFEEQVPRLDLPVFFITGRYDFTCVQDIAYRYYEQLQAPVKEFYWFEQSGHNACYTEPQKFISIVKQDILPVAEG
jgi:pimeloyl-ACP methyl ester carboxylesterase